MHENRKKFCTFVRNPDLIFLQNHSQTFDRREVKSILQTIVNCMQSFAMSPFSVQQSRYYVIMYSTPFQCQLHFLNIFFLDNQLFFALPQSHRAQEIKYEAPHFSVKQKKKAQSPKFFYGPFLHYFCVTTPSYSNQTHSQKTKFCIDSLKSYPPLNCG